jgi:hypothetical protein
MEEGDKFEDSVEEQRMGPLFNMDDCMGNFLFAMDHTM